MPIIPGIECDCVIFPLTVWNVSASWYQRCLVLSPQHSGVIFTHVFGCISSPHFSWSRKPFLLLPDRKWWAHEQSSVKKAQEAGRKARVLKHIWKSQRFFLFCEFSNETGVPPYLADMRAGKWVCPCLIYIHMEQSNGKVTSLFITFPVICPGTMWVFFFLIYCSSDLIFFDLLTAII